MILVFLTSVIKGYFYLILYYRGIKSCRAVCKVEELYTYAENKEKYGKPSRRKFFHEGIQQLEQELKNDRNKPLADIAAIKGDF